MTGQTVGGPDAPCAEHARTLAALQERVKELDCLYAISRLAERQDLALEAVLDGVAGIVARAWQYPEITRVRVVVSGTCAATPGWRRPVGSDHSESKLPGGRNRRR